MKEQVEKTKKNTKRIIGEFKEFISRGNVLDMAVGLIIGSAFTAIVKSLVDDIFMPFIGWLFGKINFENLKIVLTPAQGDVAEAAIYYGKFIQRSVDFLLIALVVFIMIKQINRFHKKKEEEPVEEKPAEPSPEIQLLTEIRDLLKNQESSADKEAE